MAAVTDCREAVWLQVNMLMSNKGTVLRCDVNGKIVMKVFLSGMPDVKLGLNDKLEVCFFLNILFLCFFCCITYSSSSAA